MEREPRGLSLVELLIVLALLLILGAFSVPKFRDAQILSKLAKVDQDFRRIQGALDNYFLDWQVYPDDHDPDDFSQQGFRTLTTPIPYLPEIFPEPFPNDEGPSYEGGSGCPVPRFGFRLENEPGCISAYLIMGNGPDRVDNTPGNDTWPYGGEGPTNIPRLLSYSPTNGSISRGDIYRMTGAYQQGYFFLDGVVIGAPITKEADR